MTPLELTEGFSWGLLVTFAGLTLAVILLTEVFGWIVEHFTYPPSPEQMRLAAVVIGVVLALTIDLLQSPPEPRALLVAGLNGCLAAMVAMKAQELVTHGTNHRVEG